MVVGLVTTRSTRNISSKVFRGLRGVNGLRTKGTNHSEAHTKKEKKRRNRDRSFKPREHVEM